MTIACASAERPSPTGPTRSAVLNFTETRSSSRPSVSGQRFADRQTVIFQLRPLQDHGGIYVYDPVARLPNQPGRMREKPSAIRAFPLRVGIREVHADIAQRGCP